MKSSKMQAVVRILRWSFNICCDIFPCSCHKPIQASTTRLSSLQSIQTRTCWFISERLIRTRLFAMWMRKTSQNIYRWLWNARYELTYELSFWCLSPSHFLSRENSAILLIPIRSVCLRHHRSFCSYENHYPIALLLGASYLVLLGWEPWILILLICVMWWLVQIRLKKEQEEKERKRKEKAEAHLYTIIKVCIYKIGLLVCCFVKLQR